MTEYHLIGLIAIIALGTAAQWVAWRAALPSILVLLGVGFVVGPATGLLRPDALLGELTFPLVSLAAAIVLFEGGLNASWDEMRSVAEPIRRLVTVGVIVTWLATAGMAWLLLATPLDISLLLGAVLVVTGPTVVGPLLRHVRPRGRVGTVAKLEGIINDPIGAGLAVLVFQAMEAKAVEHAFTAVTVGLLETAVVGALLGLGAGRLMLYLLRRRLLPRALEGTATVAATLLVYGFSQLLQHESGLLVVTVMGVAMASQSDVAMDAIRDFHEHLRTLMISSLFIVLAARIDPEVFASLPAATALFIGALVLFIRPLAVWLSTIGLHLDWRERAFLSWIAPRGIVAAALASVFDMRLSAADQAGGASVMPIVFVAITATIGIYGLTCSLVAARLGLRQRDPQGVLFVSADPVARTIARALQDQGHSVTLVDTDRAKVGLARRDGLHAEYGSAISDQVMDRLDLDGIGLLVAMTPNDEVNTLAVLHLGGHFDGQAYQLRPIEAATGEPHREPSPRLTGRVFALGATHEQMANCLRQGGTVRLTQLEPPAGPVVRDADAQGLARTVPLFALGQGQQLSVIETVDTGAPGASVIAIVPQGTDGVARQSEPEPVAGG